MSYWSARFAPRTAPRALVWYILITVAFTWPVAAGIARDVPRDLGDPLLNCWILGWNADHFLDVARGHIGRLWGLWHGNIFYPEKYTLAYSELLIAPSLEILPIYAATGNLVLCYNLLFLSTYFLSGLGMYLLARAYTGDWRTAFLAGLFFAFAPYRINQAPHIQVMSSQWMPFALYGFHAFVETRRLRAVAGGAVALMAQNLSCGYFMVFFSLFIPPFIAWEIFNQRAWRDWRIWVGFGLAAALVAAATVPLMQPYFALRALQDSRRSLLEIQSFSADVWGWLAAEEQLAFWGPRLRLLVRPEGQLFPGALPILLAAIGVIAGSRRAWQDAVRSAPGAACSSRLQGWLSAALGAVAIVASALGLLVLAGLRGRVLARMPSEPLSLENLVIVSSVATCALLLTSPRARAFASAAARSPLAFAVCCAAVAWYLSLGPDPQAAGHTLDGPRLYQFLLNHVPGFDGLRVAARFAMIVVVFLSLAASLGVRHLFAYRRVVPVGVLVSAIAALWLAETWCAPMPLNGVMPSAAEGIWDPPARVPTGVSPPPLARYLRGLPADAVLIEFPFGPEGWEMRYVYYSTLHWRRIANGFSGYTPESYRRRAKVLSNPAADPEAAWATVVDSGATHIVVHRQAYSTADPPNPSQWLERSGARFLTRIGSDDVYKVPR